jgi:hypothetical protein
MKTLFVVCILVLFCLNLQAQNEVSSAGTDSTQSDSSQKYLLFKRFYVEANYKEAIDLANWIFNDSLSHPPADIHRYLACSYYQTDNLNKAYEQMVVYLGKQDSVVIDEYDLYLSAQLAARLVNKDKRAIKILSAAYDSDTCITNKKLYAAAIINHYLKIGSKYTSTVWREKLLPLKELSKEEMHQISLAWYRFSHEGKVSEAFGQLSSVYPNAFRSLYMHRGIKMILE